MAKTKKKRSAVRIALICLGVCCLLGAAGLALYNRWEDSRAGEEAEALAASISGLLEGSALPEDADPGTDPGLRAAEDAGISFPVINVGGYQVCGIISMPSIGVEMAVIYDWDYEKLKISACRYYGNPYTQMVIMAHNYDSHFGALNRLRAGDDVIFTDMSGTAHRYYVSGAETWATAQHAELVAGDNWDLTLFTCTYGGANRVVMRCVRLEEESGELRVEN